MDVSIYVADGEITAVAGSDAGDTIKVAACYRQVLPDGAVTDGMVTNARELTAALSAFYRDNKLPGKSASLVIDGSSCVLRTMEAPKLKPNKLLPALMGQLQSQTSGFDDVVVDYMELGGIPGEPGMRVLCAAAERSMLEAYRTAFAGAGIKLTSLDMDAACAVRFLRRHPQLTAGTFIVAVLGERSMTSLLFINGRYFLLERTRLLEPRGTPASAVEISHGLSRLIQFNTAQRSSTPVTDAYLCSMRGDEYGYCMDIGQSLGITAGSLPPCSGVAGKQDGLPNYGDYLYCLGDLTRRDGKMLKSAGPAPKTFSADALQTQT